MHVLLLFSIFRAINEPGRVLCFARWRANCSACSMVSGRSRPSVSGRKMYNRPDNVEKKPNTSDGSGFHTDASTQYQCIYLYTHMRCQNFNRFIIIMMTLMILIHVDIDRRISTITEDTKKNVLCSIIAYPCLFKDRLLSHSET